MDVAAIEALASTASSAVVTAAVTDAFEGFRHKIARLFGRGEPDPAIEQKLLATRRQLADPAAADLDRLRARLEGQWQVRFEELLTSHPDAFGELDALVKDIGATAVTAIGHSAAAGRDMKAEARDGGVAANVIDGDVHTGPTRPGPASS